MDLLHTFGSSRKTPTQKTSSFGRETSEYRLHKAKKSVYLIKRFYKLQLDTNFTTKVSSSSNLSPNGITREC